MKPTLNILNASGSAMRFRRQSNDKKDYPDFKLTKNPDEILECRDIDIVTIASWDNYHYEQIIKAIRIKSIYLWKSCFVFLRSMLNIYPF